MLRVIAWKLLALLSLFLAFLGVILPVLPTVPFLLLAAAAASRGWPELDRWLLAHAVYGPPIRAWRERRAVSRRGKLYATLGLATSSLVLAVTPLPLWLRVAVPIGLAGLAIWLWRRPER